MTRILFFLTVLFLLSSSRCRKEEECHKTITIRNGSSDTIIIALIAHEDSLCCLTGSETVPGDSLILPQLRGCWEDELSGGRTQEIFIVDSRKYNQPLEFYDCDSIEIKNEILKHYILSLTDLQQVNFFINFP